MKNNDEYKMVKTYPHTLFYTSFDKSSKIDKQIHFYDYN